MSRRTRQDRAQAGKGTKAEATREARAKAQADYAAKRKAVQPLVSFRIPAKRHPSSAAKLEKMYAYLWGEYGVARGVKIPVRRKDPKKLNKLKERFGQGKAQGGLPGVKYVFVPTYHSRESDQLVRPIIRHRKSGPDVIIYRETAIDDDGDRYVASEITTQYLPFDKAAMMADPDAEVRRVGEELMANLGIDDMRQVRFRIQNGSSQMVDMLPLDAMVGQVRFLIGKYSKNDGHLWEEWLDGMAIETSGEQKTLNEYARTRRGEYSRSKKIGKINLQWSNLLRSIEQSKSSNTEAIAIKTNGSVADAPNIRQVLTTMRKKGLVSGDDNKWSLTRVGIDYLSNTRQILPLFNL